MWQDLGGKRSETDFFLCSQDDTLVSNTGFYTTPGIVLHAQGPQQQIFPSKYRTGPALLSFQNHMRTGHVQGGMAGDYVQYSKKWKERISLCF